MFILFYRYMFCFFNKYFSFVFSIVVLYLIIRKHNVNNTQTNYTYPLQNRLQWNYIIVIFLRCYTITFRRHQLDADIARKVCLTHVHCTFVVVCILCVYDLNLCLLANFLYKFRNKTEWNVGYCKITGTSKHTDYNQYRNKINQ